jgi:hypothetical protein
MFVKNKIFFKYSTFWLQIDMENNEDIREMKREILGGVQSVMKEVPVVFIYFFNMLMIHLNFILNRNA